MKDVFWWKVVCLSISLREATIVYFMTMANRSFIAIIRMTYLTKKRRNIIDVNNSYSRTIVIFKCDKVSPVGFSLPSRLINWSTAAVLPVQLHTILREIQWLHNVFVSTVHENDDDKVSQSYLYLNSWSFFRDVKRSFSIEGQAGSKASYCYRRELKLPPFLWSLDPKEGRCTSRLCMTITCV